MLVPDDPPGPAAVLLVVDRLGAVGPGRQVGLVARHLPSRLSVAVATGPTASEEDPVELPGVARHELPLAGPLRPEPDPAVLAAVRRLLAETGARVLHTHTPQAGAIGRLAALGATPRPWLVHTFHGPDLAGVASEPNRHAGLELERRLARRTDVLVTLAPETRDELVALRIGSPGQYRVIPLGLDLAPYRRVAGDSGALRAAVGVPGDVPLAGMLGPLAPDEDHAVVLQALVEVPELHLAVLGTGPLDGVIRATVHQLGLEGRVHLTGWWADVPAAVADLDVLVVARHDEATPAGLLEALAAGRPAVAVDTPGTRAAIEGGLTGWLWPTGDPQALVDGLRQVLARPVQALNRTTLARRRVVEAFGVARLAADHAQLYDALLALPPATGGTPGRRAGDGLRASGVPGFPNVAGEGGAMVGSAPWPDA